MMLTGVRSCAFSRDYPSGGLVHCGHAPPREGAVKQRSVEAALSAYRRGALLS
jgi:hypothetical protein